MQERFYTMVMVLALLGVWAPTAVAENQPADSGAGSTPAASPGAPPTSDQIQRMLGEAYEHMRAKDHVKAIRGFRDVLEIAPRSKEARFGLGTALIQLKRYRDALLLLEQLKDEFPQDYFIRNNMAWLYATASDHTVRDGPRAVALAQEALLIEPNDFHVWSTLSEAHYISGDYEKAFRAAEQALRLARRNRADPQRVREYERQADKCRRAAQALTILE